MKRDPKPLNLTGLAMDNQGVAKEGSSWPGPKGCSTIRIYVGVIWVVVKIMAPFWIPIIVRHLIFRVPNKGP